MKNKTHIRFSINVLKRLGEELYSDLTLGLLELVKNAYDADARNCAIEFENIFNIKNDEQFSLFSQLQSKIIIRDDGIGMTDEDIIQNWLLLGESQKNITQKTELGRTPVGNKGLGRLAALRLGQKAILKTVSQHDLYKQYQLIIDWAAYDVVKAVEDIELEIQTSEFSEPQTVGTEIIIEDINQTISAKQIEKLARSLILLTFPFANDESSFKATLNIPEYQKAEKLVQQGYFQEAEFHLVAYIENQMTTVNVFDWKGNQLYQAAHTDIRLKNPKQGYMMPDAKFELWVFNFESRAFSTRSSTKKEIQNWLEKYGGVHFYYNGLRVLPGEKQENWLGDSLKRITDGKKITNLIGQLLVHDEKQLLCQTTDRHGFIENAAYADLQQFTIDVNNWLAKRWQQEVKKKQQAEKERLKQEEDEASRDLQDAIDNISDEQERKRVKEESTKREKKYKQKINKIRKELQLYRTLSTTGITAAVFAHESQSNPLKVIHGSINTIERRTKQLVEYKIYFEKLENQVKRIKNSANALSVLSNVALSLVASEKRHHCKLDIHATIQKTLDLFQSFIETRDVEIQLEFSEQIPYIYGSEAALESIIANLLNNSLVAFEKKNLVQRCILIHTKITGKYVSIHVLDNGTGIEGIAVEDIWLAGETTTKNGTGLGLTIVRDTVKDMDGTVSAVAQSELEGAEIIITLPILGTYDNE